MPVTLRVCTPPVPVVVAKIVVHVLASGDVWIWNADADAVSQFSATWLMLAVDPRSTWSHCGSLNALDQRVPVLPSVALDAGKLAFSVDDAVVGLPWDSSVAAACAGPPPMMTRYAASRSAATAAMAAGSGVRRRTGPEWVTVIGYSDAD